MGGVFVKLPEAAPVILRPQAVKSAAPSLAPSPRELPPQAAEGVSLLRKRTGETDSSLRPRKVRCALFPPDGESSLHSLTKSQDPRLSRGLE